MTDTITSKTVDKFPINHSKWTEVSPADFLDVLLNEVQQQSSRDLRESKGLHVKPSTAEVRRDKKEPSC